MIDKFLPITKNELAQLGWNEADIVLITGDAYIDHPAFGTAVIARVLESKGHRVAIIAMPDWRNPDAIKIFGRPRLFFGVTSGAVDSMIANYTALKRRRSDDPYAPRGKAGHRPDRAIIVYCNLIKSAYKNVPIVIGGIEASMRRIPHYDFWDNKIRRSIIEDSRADILVYGMGESQISEIANRISSGLSLDGIPGTLIIAKNVPAGAHILPPSEVAVQDNSGFLMLYKQFNSNRQKTLAIPAAKRFLVHYPAPEINTKDMDAIYSLPFTRRVHPYYKEKIPAFEMIKNSITSHRGCASGCSFCSLSLHQGKRIISRSRKSILEEVELLAEDKEFNGRITDIGGPSANMYGFECEIKWKCKRESCTYPSLCSNLQLNTKKWINLLDQACIKKVKSVTIGSGIRYDVFMNDPDNKILLKEIINSHVSGQLKIAPEHVSARVLRAMRKSPVFDLEEFTKIFKDYNKRAGKKQYLIPYFMSCHPGSLESDMHFAKDAIKSMFGFIPDQVQMFIPLPMTLSSVIYHTGIDPLTGESFPVIRDAKDRRKQHKILLP